MLSDVQNLVDDMERVALDLEFKGTDPRELVVEIRRWREEVATYELGCPYCDDAQKEIEALGAALMDAVDNLKEFEEWRESRSATTFNEYKLLADPSSGTVLHPCHPQGLHP